LLIAWSAGDEAALEKLTPLIYGELHRLAHHYMAGEGAGHTLQTTALINEAYVRPIEGARVQFRDRAHFFALSAKMMRRILVDFGRSRRSQKRGGARPARLEETAVASPDGSPDLAALDEALERYCRG
jgi:RNA polymerase sigma factor (TIGR02999 family)